MFDELEQYEKQAAEYADGIDRFSQYLMHGEEILWQGESQKGGGMKVNGGGAFYKCFAVFWLAFAIFWTVTATLSGGIFGFFGIPFVIIGVLLFTKNGEKKYYAITNRRVLTLTKNGLNAEFLGKICNIRIISGKNNIGSVFFGINDVVYVSRGDDSGFRQAGGGIYSVYDPQEVYRILNDAVYSAQNTSGQQY